MSDLLGLKHSNERRENFAAKLCAPKLVLHVSSNRNSDFCLIVDRPKFVSCYVKVSVPMVEVPVSNLVYIH